MKCKKLFFLRSPLKINVLYSVQFFICDLQKDLFKQRILTFILSSNSSFSGMFQNTRKTGGNPVHTQVS